MVAAIAAMEDRRAGQQPAFASFNCSSGFVHIVFFVFVFFIVTDASLMATLDA
jgi:hypothetical protein